MIQPNTGMWPVDYFTSQPWRFHAKMGLEGTAWRCLTAMALQTGDYGNIFPLVFQMYFNDFHEEKKVF
jgi:hypothetical protein